MVRSSFYRPQLAALENRLQPGSIFTGIIDTSLLAGGLGVLGQSLLSPVSHTSEQTATASQVAVVDRGAAEVLVPELAPARQQDAVLAQPVVSEDLVQAVLASVVPAGNSGGGRITGGACEEGGNIVVNGDFEAGGAPWFQIGDPFAAIRQGGGHLTPDRHLVVGAVGSTGLVYQDIQTEADVVYTIRISAYVGEGQPYSLAVRWGDDVVADLTDALTPDYQRFELVASVVGTGGEVRFGFQEQHDPDYIHIDDVCVTPYVK